MASRSTAKGILPVLRSDAPGFDAAFERLVQRRQERAEDIEKTVRRIVSMASPASARSSNPATPIEAPAMSTARLRVPGCSDSLRRERFSQTTAGKRRTHK